MLLKKVLKEKYRTLGLPISLIDVVRYDWPRKPSGMRKQPLFWWSVINIVVVWLTVVLTSRLILVLKGISQEGLTIGLIFGLIAGLPVGMIFGIRGSRQDPESDIQTVEALRWSWRKALKGGLIGGLSGGPIMVLFARLFGLLLELGGLEGQPSDASNGSSLWWLGGGLFFGLIGASFNGLSREIIETKSIPNQGIRLSIRNAIFSGLIVGPLSGLIFGLIFWRFILIYPEESIYNSIIGLIAIVLQVGPAITLTFGLFAVLWYGGLDVVQHYTLRLILVLQKHTPTNYDRFLDYCVDRIFLQKVGGGYRFIHRLLLEHFAELGETKKHV